MKKSVTSLKIVLPAIALIFLVSACRKSTSTTPVKVKSAKVTFKVAAVKTSSKSAAATHVTAINVKGGTINLASAWVSFGQINIQENTGNDNQQTGGADKESSTGTEANDSADIFLPGPYAFNVVSDTLTLSQVQVFPGTFKKVDLKFLVKNDTLFNGNSIVIKGQFKPTSGSAVNLVLRSKFAQQIELKLAKGITVAANSKVSMSIVFTLNKWVASLDLTKATLTSGSIIIDAAHNKLLLRSFETALSNANEGMQLNEEYGSSTGTDTATDAGDNSSESSND